MSFDLFVSQGDEIVVNFAACLDKNDPKTIYADVSVEKLKEVYGDDVDESTVQEHTATFRRPNFDDMSRLYDEAFSFDGQQVKAHASSMRIRKMTRLLKSWSLPRPATAQEVRSLSPVIAIVIGAELDRLAP